MKIIISADGRKLCASTGGQPLTSGSVGIEAAFVLSADYDGLTVTAVFRAGDVSVDVLLTGPSCTVPWEVLQTSGHVLVVGVVGKNGSGEIVIPTIWGRVGMVECGTVAEGIDPQDPTPDIAAQLLQIAQETVDRAETAETTATEAATVAGESATAAGEAKTDAEAAAQDAEAWAVGKRGGTDVGSTDPAYHNNAKYYAEEVGEAAPFYAVYGVTTKAEIQSAINGKRQILLSTEGLAGVNYTPFVDTFLYADIRDEGTGYRFASTTGTNQYVYELRGEWSEYINDLAAPAQRAEEAAAAAASSKAAAEGSATAAASSATAAAGSASDAATAKTAAEAAQTAAAASARAASASADRAASSATAASGSATAAASSATAAGNAKTAAETAQGKAEDAQEAAEQAQEAAEAVLESIPADYSDLSDDVDDLKSAKAPVIIDTASGAIAHFEDGADGMPIKSLTVNIEPVQAGSGEPSPENVRLISGWTGCNVTRSGSNLLDPDIIEFGAYNQNASPIANGDNRYRRLAMALPTGDFVFHTALPNGYIIRMFVDDTYVQGHMIDDSSIAFNLAKPGVVKICFRNADTTAITEPFNSQINIGTTLAEYEPYHGNTYPITFPASAGTVYGGLLDVSSGVLTADRAGVDMGTLTWTAHANVSGIFYCTIPTLQDPETQEKRKNGIISSSYATTENISINADMPNNSMLRYSSHRVFVRDNRYTLADDFKSAVNGIQLIYILDNPVSYHLPAQQITTLLGTNNIWADCGDVMVEYPADTKLYIQKINAPTDDDMIADARIESGKYFLIGNTLYLSTTLILAGENIIPGTNCTKTNLAAALNTLNT